MTRFVTRNAVDCSNSSSLLKVVLRAKSQVEVLGGLVGHPHNPSVAGSSPTRPTSSSKMTVTGRATAPGGAQRSRDGVGPSGGGGEGDGVAEGLQAADVAADGALGAGAGVVV